MKVLIAFLIGFAVIVSSQPDVVDGRVEMARRRLIEKEKEEKELDDLLNLPVLVRTSRQAMVMMGYQADEYITLSDGKIQRVTDFPHHYEWSGTIKEAIEEKFNLEYDSNALKSDVINGFCDYHGHVISSADWKDELFVPVVMVLDANRWKDQLEFCYQISKQRPTGTPTKVTCAFDNRMRSECRRLGLLAFDR